MRPLLMVMVGTIVLGGLSLWRNHPPVENSMRLEIKQNPRTLVIFYGNQRGGNLTWASMKKHLLGPLGNAVDVAVLFKSTPSFPTPRYDWSRTVVTPPSNVTWGRICELKYQRSPWGIIGLMFGNGLCSDHRGTGGKLLLHRWRAQVGISALKEEYDYYIFTRTDYLYLRDHFDVHALKKDVNCLYGDEWGGVNDKHIVIRGREKAIRALNITQDILFNPHLWYELIKTHRISNLEQLIKNYLDKEGIEFDKIPPTMITVRKIPEDSGETWSTGIAIAPFSFYGLHVKMPTELESVKSFFPSINISQELLIFNRTSDA